MMRSFVLTATLALLLGTFSGCIIEGDNSGPDREITCGHFDDFLFACTSNCTVSWDCEFYYDSLSYDDQISLDNCSDCLADNLSAGICADCHDSYVGSCQGFMEALLGADCW